MFFLKNASNNSHGTNTLQFYGEFSGLGDAITSEQLYEV